MRTPSGSPSRPGLKPDGSRDEELKLPIRPGDTVGDKYVVEGTLGTGGVGVVVSARHTKLDERVAIKFLQTSAMKSAENVSRFDREARAAARIKSEHVARVMDFGALPSGAPYMVLEHLDGLDLGALLRAQGRVPYEAAVDYVVQACEAVVEAHSIGIVHRDLKPANLFLAKRPDGSAIVKVLDFGISKLLAKDGTPDLAMTQTSSVIGSPLYMSPEQMQSPRDANELSDIWSLGVILYELLSGSPPFEAATMPLLCAKICCGEPTPLSDRFKPGDRPPPVELEAAIMLCLQRDPEQRPGSVAELVRLIAPYGTEDSQIACERITRVASQAGMTVSATPSEARAQVAAAHRASLASIHPLDPPSDHSDAPPSEGRHWSWTPGVPVKRRGPRNIALLGLVLAAGFGLGAWGMSARASHGPVVHAKASGGREIVLATRGSVLAFEMARAKQTAREGADAPKPTDASTLELGSADAAAEPSEGETDPSKADPSKADSSTADSSTAGASKAGASKEALPTDGAKAGVTVARAPTKADATKMQKKPGSKKTGNETTDVLSER